MAKKLLVARLGVGSLTIALCAGLPGCNLAVRYDDPCRKSSWTTTACAGDDGSALDLGQSSSDVSRDVPGDVLQDVSGDRGKESGSGDTRTDTP